MQGCSRHFCSRAKALGLGMVGLSTRSWLDYDFHWKHCTMPGVLALILGIPGWFLCHGEALGWVICLLGISAEYRADCRLCPSLLHPGVRPIRISLDIVGYCWILLGIVGYYWILLGKIGFFQKYQRKDIHWRYPWDIQTYPYVSEPHIHERYPLILILLISYILFRIEYPLSVLI